MKLLVLELLLTGVFFASATLLGSVSVQLRRERKYDAAKLAESLSAGCARVFLLGIAVSVLHILYLLLCWVFA